MAKKKKVSPRTEQKSTNRSFIKESAWSRVVEEVGQGWELRKELIGKIERRLRGTVIVYFSSFYDEDVMMSDMDAEMIEGILAVEHSGGKIILILNSAGGSGLAAERIVNVCRSYSAGRFEVIVPHMAKSAATLICFGASRIHMSATAELGPVDPQVKYRNDATGEKEWISAQEYVRSYEQLMEKAVSGEAKRIETLVQQLARYDARYIEQLKSAQALSESISIKLLQSGMMSRFTEDTIRSKISPFLIQAKTKSHSRMINMAEAKQHGLRINEILLQSELWNWLWELYIRANWAVSARSRKILESARSGIGT
ncbi:MAG: SDH family Clp fold serine proteinase [Planctomycetota bacterium]|jgi:ClpP class serine protease